jgi:hypothetical protein
MALLCILILETHYYGNDMKNKNFIFFSAFQLFRPEHHWRDFINSWNAHLVHQYWYHISFALKKSYWFWNDIHVLDLTHFRTVLCRYLWRTYRRFILNSVQHCVAAQKYRCYGNMCPKENQWEIHTFWKLHSNGHFLTV